MQKLDLSDKLLENALGLYKSVNETNESHGDPTPLLEQVSAQAIEELLQYHRKFGPLEEITPSKNPKSEPAPLDEILLKLSGSDSHEKLIFYLMRTVFSNTLIHCETDSEKICLWNILQRNGYVREDKCDALDSFMRHNNFGVEIDEFQKTWVWGDPKKASYTLVNFSELFPLTDETANLSKHERKDK